MARKKLDNISTITVQDAAVTVLSREGNDYISLTDMAREFGGDDVIRNWMRARSTIEFLGTWEVIHNPEFKPVDFDRFKSEAGSNTFTMAPKKWVEATGAVGIYSRAGRTGGGTFAHNDIALEFATWLSPAFKLYLIKEIQRLKKAEAEKLSEAWQLNRALAKLNYKIHTSAVKEHLIPATVTRKQASITYANEADILNVAVFGKTAREWKDENPGISGNMRDEADLAQLLVLTNLESQNATFIEMGLPQSERLERLNQMAIRQLKALEVEPRLQTLPGAISADE